MPDRPPLLYEINSFRGTLPGHDRGPSPSKINRNPHSPTFQATISDAIVAAERILQRIDDRWPMKWEGVRFNAMADKTPLKIAPDLFRWARESVGLPILIAARRIGVKPEKLEEWEGKEALPTPRQLEKAADAYKRPVAMFFLSAPPKEPPLPIDFRSPKDATLGDFSTMTRLAIRRARWLKEVYSEIAEVGRAAVPQIDDSRPESVADVIRGWLASTLNAVKGKQPNDALRIWRDSLEAAGKGSASRKLALSRSRLGVVPVSDYLSSRCLCQLCSRGDPRSFRHSSAELDTCALTANQWPKQRAGYNFGASDLQQSDGSGILRCEHQIHAARSPQQSRSRMHSRRLL